MRNFRVVFLSIASLCCGAVVAPAYAAAYKTQGGKCYLIRNDGTRELASELPCAEIDELPGGMVPPDSFRGQDDRKPDTGHAPATVGAQAATSRADAPLLFLPEGSFYSPAGKIIVECECRNGGWCWTRLGNCDECCALAEKAFDRSSLTH